MNGASGDKTWKTDIFEFGHCFVLEIWKSKVAACWVLFSRLKNVCWISSGCFFSSSCVHYDISPAAVRTLLWKCFGWFWHLLQRLPACCVVEDTTLGFLRVGMCVYPVSLVAAAKWHISYTIVKETRLMGSISDVVRLGKTWKTHT